MTYAVESVDAWYRRYHEYQRELGRNGQRYAWRKCISPRIGHLPWGDVTPELAEQIRDDVDAAVVVWQTEGPGRSGGLAGRTAYDLWSLLTGAVRAARTSKRRDLRVLVGRPSPCQDVEPPGDASTRRQRCKTFIYPSEFMQLVTCRRVPRARRALYAIAAYTYLRTGELMVLRWADIDLAHGVVRVTKAFRYHDCAVKAPRTMNGVRDVPFHRGLMPLLRRMRRSADPKALVAPEMREVHRITLPRRLRMHLLTAGVDRAALHESTLTTVRASFRSWRDTGITWLAIEGLDVARIMRRAGHDDITTTMRYVKRAEDLSHKLGTPFPRLPRELIAGGR
jgi:integrase